MKSNVLVWDKSTEADILAINQRVLVDLGFGRLINGVYVSFEEFETKGIFKARKHPTDNRWFIYLSDVAGTKYAAKKYRQKINNWEEIALDFLTPEQVAGLKDQAWLIAEGFLPAPSKPKEQK